MCARYISDQNALGFFYESGTYANASGALHWIGEVQDHTIDENTNVIENRFLGTGTRNVDQFVDGAKDYTGTITYYPQDWKMLMFALGSNVDAGSPSPYTHTISEVNSASGNAFTSGTNNPFISFGLEDSHKATGTGNNFVRTVKGAMVDSLSITSTQGEPISVEVGYIAQDCVYSSGAPTALTATTTRPFLWRDTLVHIPSGTTINNITETTYNFNNGMEGKHYLNGSEVIGVPIPENRTHEVNITLDGNSETTKTFYDQYFLGGSVFNMMLEVNASTGSRDMFLVLSGCKLMDMEAPTPNEGVNEQTLTIMGKEASVVVNDTTELYNAW